MPATLDAYRNVFPIIKPAKRRVLPKITNLAANCLTGLDEVDPLSCWREDGY